MGGRRRLEISAFIGSRPPRAGLGWGAMFKPTYGLEPRQYHVKTIYKVRDKAKRAEVFKIGHTPYDSKPIFLLKWEDRNIPFIYLAPIELTQVNLKNDARIKYAQFPVLDVFAGHIGADIARFQCRGASGGYFDTHHFEGMAGPFYTFESQTEYDRAVSLLEEALPALAYDGHLHGGCDPAVCVEVTSQKTPWNKWSSAETYCYSERDWSGNYISFARQLLYVSARLRGMHKLGHYELLRNDELTQQIAAKLMAYADEHVTTFPDLVDLLMTDRVKETRPGCMNFGDVMRDKVAEQIFFDLLAKSAHPAIDGMADSMKRIRTRASQIAKTVLETRPPRLSPEQAHEQLQSLSTLGADFGAEDIMEILISTEDRFDAPNFPETLLSNENFLSALRVLYKNKYSGIYHNVEALMFVITKIMVTRSIAHSERRFPRRPTPQPAP